MRPQLRKFAFAKMRKALEQFLARHQRQHRIPQKFQLLVVAHFVLAVAGLLRFLLARLRTVRDRLFNDCAPPEMVAQPLFQRRDFPFLHKWGQPPSAVRRAPLAAFWFKPKGLLVLDLVLRWRTLPWRGAAAQLGQAILLLACRFADTRVWPIFG